MELALPMTSYMEKYRYKYLALYHSLRDAIREGRLPAGSKLPSTRYLANLYGISRGSVTQSYEMLLSEGYVQMELGRGTFVAHSGPSPQLFQPSPSDIQLSSWGQRMTHLQGISTMEPSLPEVIRFLPEAGSMDYFPYAEWRSSLAYAGGRGGESLHHFTHPAGEIQLREAIAGHLRVTRGMDAQASNIVLFSGSMQGIVLLTQLLVNEGDPVIVENPGYHGIHRAVQACGGMILSADVDASGIIPQDWKARMLFVTPSRQYPTGAVLSLGRRRQLLAWAQKNAAVIVEDDYDSEFRWGGRPIEPLKTLDDGDRVIYLGSFSKTMFAGLRLGYAVLPSSLVEPVACAKALYDPFSTGVLEQRALAHFMSRGHYGRHLRRMTRIFGAKYDILCSLMTKHVPELFTIVPGDAGLHVYALWQQSPQQFTAFVSAAKARGVEFRDASLYRLESGPPAVCFGFAHLDENMLTEGVLRLVQAWKDVQKQSGQSIMDRQ